MNLFIFLLMLLSITTLHSQNFIFKSDKGNYYSHANNYKIEFNQDNIRFVNENESYKISFVGKDKEKVVLNTKQNSTLINYYKANDRIEDLKVYSTLQYGNIVVQISDKLDIYNLENNEVIFEKNGKYNLKDIQNNTYKDIVRINNTTDFYYLLTFSSIIGSGESLSGSSSKDEYGNVYFSGYTRTNLGNWIKDAYDSIIAYDQDYFVIKLDKNDNVVWGTYIGSKGLDGSCYIDTRFGMVWVAGESWGNGFPVSPNAVRKTVSDAGDISVFRLDYDGKLLYGTYNGDKRYDAAIDVKIDDDSTAWVGGRTGGYFGFFFTTPDTYSIANRGYDAFLMGFENKNNDCIYSAFYGGKGSESLESLCFTKDKIIIGGYSESKSLDKQIGNYTGSNMLMALNKGDRKLVWSYKFPEQAYTNVQNLCSLDSNRFIVTGYTDALNIGFGDVFRNTKTKNDLDMFISIINEDGQIEKTTYFGGSSNEGRVTSDFQGGGIYVDDDKNIYISGYTISTDLPTTDNAVQKTLGGSQDIFFAVFDENLKELKYSSYFGGTKDENGRDILYANNKIYLNGWTRSIDFPITDNAIQKNVNGSYSAYLSILYNLVQSLPCDDNFYEYDGFQNIDGLVLSANAVTYDSTLRLTKEDFFQKGAVWTENAIDISAGLTSEFVFKLSNGDDKGNEDGSNPGADGLTFVIQGDKTNVIGYAGGGIGYENLKNAFAIELDLFQNAEDGYNDPNGKHLAIFASKDKLSANHKSNDLVFVNPDIDDIKVDKSLYKFKVVYSIENQTLDVYINPFNQQSKNVCHLSNFDLSEYINLINGKNAFLGITAATGTSIQRHELTYWSFCGGKRTSSVESVRNDLVFPNPAKNVLFIKDELRNSEIQIFDLFGNKCNFVKNNSQLDISALKTGVYFIQFNFNGKIQTQKFIVGD